MHRKISANGYVALCGAELAERNVPRFLTTRDMDVSCSNCLERMGTQPTSEIYTEGKSNMRTILFLAITAEELTGGENTFRAGEKYNDLRIGEVVNLALTAEPEKSIGQAVVKGVVSDCLGILLASHGHNNHAVMHGEERGDFALQKLKADLDSIYGPQEGHETFAAVYLDRLTA